MLAVADTSKLFCLRYINAPTHIRKLKATLTSELRTYSNVQLKINRNLNMFKVSITIWLLASA